MTFDVLRPAHFTSLIFTFLCVIILFYKMESELGNHEDDEDYDDASEIALLL